MTTHYYDGLPAITADAEDLDSPTIREIFVKTRRLAAILDGCLIGPTQTPEDLSALAWILQSLEDIEATIAGLVQSADQPSPAEGNLPPASVYRKAIKAPFLFPKPFRAAGSMTSTVGRFLTSNRTEHPSPH